MASASKSQRSQARGCVWGCKCGSRRDPSQPLRCRLLSHPSPFQWRRRVRVGGLEMRPSPARPAGERANSLVCFCDCGLKPPRELIELLGLGRIVGIRILGCEADALLLVSCPDGRWSLPAINSSQPTSGAGVVMGEWDVRRSVSTRQHGSCLHIHCRHAIHNHDDHRRREAERGGGDEQMRLPTRSSPLMVIQPRQILLVQAGRRANARRASGDRPGFLVVRWRKRVAWWGTGRRC